MKPSEFLSEAKALIERGWSTGSFARDRDGYPDVISSSAACKFCAMGALKKVYFNHERQYNGQHLSDVQYYAMTALTDVINVKGGGLDYVRIIHWNDKVCQSKADAIAGFDQAIELAKANEKDWNIHED